MSSRLPYVLCLVWSGCAADESLSPIDKIIGDDGCSSFVCGANTSLMGGFPFFQLAKDGTPSPEANLAIVGFTSAWNEPMTVEVKGHTLIGRTSNGGEVSGLGLVNSVLYLHSTYFEPPVDYKVRIDSFHQSVPLWQHPENPTRIESYGLEYIQIGLGPSWRNVCPTPTYDPDMFPGVAPYEALIFAGDRYDIHTGEVIDIGGAAEPWFTIACAGDVLAKLPVIQYADSTQTVPHTTSKDQRTAAGRMFRADYCGNSVSYTVLGTNLHWANKGKWNTFAEAATTNNIEAIWDQRGARCLTRRRHPELGPPPGPVNCPATPTSPARVILPCTNAQINHWTTYGEFITTLPWLAP